MWKQPTHDSRSWDSIEEIEKELDPMANRPPFLKMLAEAPHGWVPVQCARCGAQGVGPWPRKDALCPDCSSSDPSITRPLETGEKLIRAGAVSFDGKGNASVTNFRLPQRPAEEKLKIAEIDDGDLKGSPLDESGRIPVGCGNLKVLWPEETAAVDLIGYGIHRRRVFDAVTDEPLGTKVITVTYEPDGSVPVEPTAFPFPNSPRCVWRDGQDPHCYGHRPRAGDRRFHAVLREMADLHAQKGADYGKGDDVFRNIRASEEWGIPAWQGALIRACDKIKRLQSFVEKCRLENESVEDSLIDLACYAAIGLVLLREDQGKEGFEKP